MKYVQMNTAKNFHA